MGKLWEKGYVLNPIIEKYTVGDDYLLDQKLIFYDCLGSIAHAAMLKKIGIVSLEEFQEIQKDLQEIIQSDLEIDVEDEDVHTAIENFLGDVGKKLHTGRSRNDQVHLDIRLYCKDHLLKVTKKTLLLAKGLVKFAKEHEFVAIPGRTHMQPAMPSSMGLWAGSFAESLVDNCHVLRNTFEIIDQSPLGSAASYGTSLPIDRCYTAELLGFNKVQNNVLYSGNSRGKFEGSVVFSLLQVMQDLSKISQDLLFFTLPEIGYCHLPETVCSGSSIMPNKRNPDALELVRAKSATVTAHLMQIMGVCQTLPSGYHRDLQETKKPLFESFDITLDSIEAMNLILSELFVDKTACEKGFTPELFSTDIVNLEVMKGKAFRDAYKKIATKVDQWVVEDTEVNLKKKIHSGAPGNLGLEQITESLKKIESWTSQSQNKWKKTVNHLLGEIK